MDTTRTPPDADQQARLSQLAAAVDCITEEELNLLTNTTPGTTASWRKRGRGPRYVLVGNRYLYPRDAVAEFVRQNERRPSQSQVRRCL